MNIVTKATASIQPASDDETSENGSFDVILSAQTLDRDGDTLKSDEWKTPLPEHITFDTDHGMTVSSTVGSGKPFINDDGDLQVRGTYSSIPRAQEVRTLVNEGHIRTTSVAFMTTKTAKAHGAAERELLNGAFVAVPSNRDTLVLASKALEAVEKAGARNSAADAKQVQSIHDSALALGANCDTADGEADGANKSLKAATKDADDDAGKLAGAVDAALDEAVKILAAVDVKALPPEVQQAIALVNAAEESVDKLLDVMGVPDPDDDEGDEMKSLKSASWDGSASRFTIEQWRRSCLIGPSKPSESKSDYKLPVREPDGTVNGNAVHAAAAALAGGRGGVNAPAADKEKAAKTLVGLYRKLKETPPDSLLSLAGESSNSSKSTDATATAVKAAAAASADEEVALRARALLIQAQSQSL